MRQPFVVLVVLVGLTSFSTAAQAGKTSIVLGKKNVVSHSTGWGTARPKVIDNGGDPSGRAWNLRWTGWGSATTEARGLTSLFKPQGGYYAKPGAIELRASQVGHCTVGGPSAYTHLEGRVALRPGGPLGRWFVWGGWKSTCKPF